jgi:hypothetical protein
MAQTTAAPLKGPQARQIQNYACHCLALKSYFQQPGDGRAQPQISASDMAWAVVMGRILRVTSFLRLEWLVHSPARPGLGVKAPFGDDALAYCTERMDPEATRLALAAALRQAKRNKAFENSRFIGLAVDGTGGWLWPPRCARPSATRPSRTAASSAWLWTARARGAPTRNPARGVIRSKMPREWCTVRCIIL